VKVSANGPAAAGKGTICRGFAIETGIDYVDLGMIFRAIALILGTKRCANIDEVLVAVRRNILVYSWTNCIASMRFHDEDLTPLLSSQEVAGMTAELASNGYNMAVLRIISNEIIGARKDVIADGRNAGTTILEDADFKFFITADLAVRARRRLADLARDGKPSTYEVVYEKLQTRDELDIRREVDPLIQPVGAVVIETDKRSIAESIALMRSVVQSTT